MIHWTSPDGKIKKEILKSGSFGIKPYEQSQCTITITDSPFLEEYNKRIVTIGDSDGDLWRALDICLMTMFVGEKSKFILDLNNNIISLVIELLTLTFNGFIYEWDAKKKYDFALHHKEKGIEFFRLRNHKEAAFRFTKALKILSSIPVDVERLPDIETIDGIRLTNINNLKGNLFNNLSSCYFRNQVWDMVKELCKKVLTFDDSNVKALYKLGVAYENENNFEKANACFSKILKLEPENTAAAEHAHLVKKELQKSEVKMNNMIKKMFHGAMEK